MLPKHHSGFSLLEILLSVTLSAILILTVLQAFTVTKQLRRKQQALTSIMHQGRFVATVMKYAILQAGYTGCRHLHAVGFKLINPAPTLFSLIPYQIKHAGRHTKIGSKRLLPDSDYLQTEAMSQAETIQSYNAKQRRIIVSRQTRFKKNQWLMISDCKQAQIFQIAKLKKRKHSQVIISQQALLTHFSNHSQLGFYQKNSFFIANTTRRYLGKPITALYQQQNNKRHELIENVQGLAITKQAKRFHIESLLSSRAAILAKPMPYVFAGKTSLATDRKYYVNWPVTVTVW